MRNSSLTVPPIIIEGQYEIIPRSPFRRLRALAWIGIGLVAVFIAGFGTWAAVAPLESAAIAPGFIEANSSRKTIQHLEGGIIERILVRDGQFVAAGQTLIELADTRPRTSLASLRSQYWDALAREARLIAERDNRDHVTYPAKLLEERSDPAVAEIIAGQTRIFETRRSLFVSQSGLIQQRVAQVQEEVVGLKAQAVSAGKQSELIKQELADVLELYKKGYARKPKMLALERELASLEGRLGETAAKMAQARQVIAESELTLANLKNDKQDQVATELRDTQVQVSQLREQMAAASDVMARTAIRAPEDGIVTALRVHTPGGTIAPGQPLLDLIPAEDRLVIKAQIRPDDIDRVHRGLPAQVRLTPYKQQLLPPLDGHVSYVSADHMIDEHSGQAYYAATIEIEDAALKYNGSTLAGKVAGLVGGPHLVPGMPAEVMIKTGETTVALYALAPILYSFNRAFREN